MDIVAAVQDFDFLGGSLGMAAGEAIITGMTAAVERRTPFIIFTASGGARMQEGIFSLMQMPRTTIAVQRLRDAKLPYIVVLTNPTTGGVTASYAMLGDVHIAEPGAVIGFAGARVIEQTIRERLPEGFQRAEYLEAHGMIDMVVKRQDMRATLARLCALVDPDPADRASGRLRAAKQGQHGFARRASLPPLHAASQDDRTLAWPDRAAARARLVRRNSACRRSFTSPEPMAKVRRLLSCAPFSKRRESASMSIPRRIWCGFMSASDLARTVAAGSSAMPSSLPP